MTAFDVMCLTSSGMEGFPNVLGEAMSCGVPCVGTCVGDVGELVGDTGAVVATGDSDAIAAAVVELLSLQPEARRARGERARARIDQHFSISEVAGRYASFVYSVAAAPR
jgi:glycosyltransferase involved in cell wall biosynthesis